MRKAEFKTGIWVEGRARGAHQPGDIEGRLVRVSRGHSVALSWSHIRGQTSREVVRRVVIVVCCTCRGPPEALSHVTSDPQPPAQCARLKGSRPL